MIERTEPLSATMTSPHLGNDSTANWSAKPSSLSSSDSTIWQNASAPSTGLSSSMLQLDDSIVKNPLSGMSSPGNTYGLTLEAEANRIAFQNSTSRIDAAQMLTDSGLRSNTEALGLLSADAEREHPHMAWNWTRNAPLRMSHPMQVPRSMHMPHGTWPMPFRGNTPGEFSMTGQDPRLFEQNCMPFPRMAGPIGWNGHTGYRGDPAHDRGNQEITTLFIAGFPEDISDREFSNLFLFARGFEASMLKHSNSPSSNEGEGDGRREEAPAKNRQIIGFAKFQTREDAFEARDILNGFRIDPERGCVLKAELAKKNLHTKRSGPSGACKHGHSYAHSRPPLTCMKAPMLSYPYGRYPSVIPSNFAADEFAREKLAARAQCPETRLGSSPWSDHTFEPLAADDGFSSRFSSEMSSPLEKMHLGTSVPKPSGTHGIMRSLPESVHQSPDLLVCSPDASQSKSMFLGDGMWPSNVAEGSLTPLDTTSCPSMMRRFSLQQQVPDSTAGFNGDSTFSFGPLDSAVLSPTKPVHSDSDMLHVMSMMQALETNAPASQQAKSASSGDSATTHSTPSVNINNDPGAQTHMTHSTIPQAEQVQKAESKSEPDPSK